MSIECFDVVYVRPAPASLATGLTEWPDMIDHAPSGQSLSTKYVAAQMGLQNWPEESSHAATLVTH